MCSYVNDVIEWKQWEWSNAPFSVQCPESIDGFYPHPTRCDLYIQCDNVQSPWPSVQVLSCPSGLHWNPFAQHCDWPELACCNATSHATATPPPTTTTTRTYEQNGQLWLTYEEVMAWKTFPLFCPLFRGIHRSPVGPPYKGSVMQTYDYPLLLVGKICWINSRVVSDLRPREAHVTSL